MDPSTFLNVYRLDLMSSIKISYGVSSYSIGVLEKLTFFNLTPILSSPMTCIQNRACEILLAMSHDNIIAMLQRSGERKLVTDILFYDLTKADNIKNIEPYYQENMKVHNRFCETIE